MDIDDLIVELGERLDAWTTGFFAMLDSKDRVAQATALGAGVEIVKGLGALKAKGLAALRALLRRQDAASEDERVASLVGGFVFATKLADALHDELLDTAGEKKVGILGCSIVETLDTIGSGRAALAVLLDHPDAGVRASAGAFLINLMPDRALPVLREIEEKNGSNSAYFKAHWAVLDWDLKQKARAKE